MSFYLKLLKQANKKREYHISEVLPVSSFALAFPVYTHLVDRKQRRLRFSAMHHRNVLLDLARLNSESSKTCLCLAVILMHLFKFRDGLY